MFSCSFGRFQSFSLYEQVSVQNIRRATPTEELAEVSKSTSICCSQSARKRSTSCFRFRIDQGTRRLFLLLDAIYRKAFRNFFTKPQRVRYAEKRQPQRDCHLRLAQLNLVEKRPGCPPPRVRRNSRESASGGEEIVKDSDPI